MESIYRFRRAGGTLLLVSHDLNTIQSLCTRALWIDDGRVRADGPPGEVIQAYKQSLAAQDTAGQTAAPDGSGQRWGSGEVTITEVELCDAAGRPRTSFMTGDNLAIRLRYRSAQRVEQPVFGLAINHQNGTHLFGPNTKLAAMDIPFVDGEGELFYTLPNLPLLEGQYVVSVAVVNHADTVTYDYHDRVYGFRVVHSPARTGYGMVQMPGVWRHAPAPSLQRVPAADATVPHLTEV
jgi:hypothetical protein